jgi:hypothetical protein
MKAPLTFLLLCFVVVSSSFAQDSNPDGMIGKPSITLLGAIQRGSGEISVLNTPTLKQDTEFKAWFLGGNITYPVTRTVSLIFEVGGVSQESKHPETLEFFGSTSELRVYSFTFGIRMFTQ